MIAWAAAVLKAPMYYMKLIHLLAQTTVASCENNAIPKGYIMIQNLNFR